MCRCAGVQHATAENILLEHIQRKGIFLSSHPHVNVSEPGTCCPDVIHWVSGHGARLRGVEQFSDQIRHRQTPVDGDTDRGGATARGEQTEPEVPTPNNATGKYRGDGLTEELEVRRTEGTDETDRGYRRDGQRVQTRQTEGTDETDRGYR